jgi:dihydrofolate synthase/folylpolyglutamate synthase
MALGLEHTKTVLERLALPHLPEHILHVAGSNGKGTVCAIMAGALILDGTSSLLFSSPHLIRVEERIRIDGVPVAPLPFERALNKVRAASDLVPKVVLTFFESTYLAAMQCASDFEVDVLILETGLGGRKDATRSGPATASLVTSISTEHRDVLGHDLPLISKEKAAIARPGCPIIVRQPLHQDVKLAILEEIEDAGQSILDEPKAPAMPLFVSIPPEASVRDEACLLARAVFEAVGLPTHRVNESSNRVQWPARMQHIVAPNTGSHPYLLDAAHNPSGLLRVLPELEHRIKQSPDGWSLLFGTSPQHDLEAFCQPLIELCTRHPPHQILFTEPQGGRYPAVSSTTLSKLGWPGKEVFVEPMPDAAVNHLHSIPSSSVGLVVSLGSLYLQGNLLDALGHSSDEALSLVAKQ